MNISFKANLKIKELWKIKKFKRSKWQKDAIILTRYIDGNKFLVNFQV